MRRHADELTKDARELKWTHAGVRCKSRQRVLLARAIGQRCARRFDALRVPAQLRAAIGTIAVGIRGRERSDQIGGPAIGGERVAIDDHLSQTVMQKRKPVRTTRNDIGETKLALAVFIET